MTFSINENIIPGSSESAQDLRLNMFRTHLPPREETHLLAGKMKIPNFDFYLDRPRLSDALRKSCEQFGATLITGRAGTGKSALTADFAAGYENVSWLRLDSADCDWKTFSRYFAESLKQTSSSLQPAFADDDDAVLQLDVSQFTERKIAAIEPTDSFTPHLIVIDDAHHIFDAAWFEDFFTTLIYSLTPEIHLVLLSRGAPSLPLWRMRSKQSLGVIDESLLAFNLEETRRLLAYQGLPTDTAETLRTECFGRISRLKNISEST